MMAMMGMMRTVLLVAALTAACEAILPEIINSGVSHILEENSSPEQTQPDHTFVEVEQLREEQQHPEEVLQQEENQGVSVRPEATDHPAGLPNATDSGSHTGEDQETNDISNVTSTTDHYSDLGNLIHQGCIADEDCGTGRYCLDAAPDSKCMPCKGVDVSCTKDEQCCDGQLCVWGQCSANATKAEAGSTCRYQTDCSPDLCCALHKVLVFPVCQAKPIERERCFGASNHLMELLSWSVQDNGPQKHCPCAGELFCQHLGRGSMCMRGEASSEEELTDTLYSDIDYII